jgi:beta-N-acetylhexosaminidase
MTWGEPGMNMADRGVLWIGSLAIIAILAAGCISPRTAPTPIASEQPSSPGQTSAPSPTASSVPPSALPASPSIAPTPSPSTAITSCASRTLTSLSEAQRIGQLFNVGLDKDRLDSASRQAIIANHFGSVWYRAKTTIGVAGVRKVADAAQALATTKVTGGVRFFVAANQEGGLIQALSGPGFETIPSAVEQGKLEPAALEARAAVWGQQLRAAGVNMDFAPVADVVPAGTEAQNAPIGQLKREFGSDPLVVAPHVVAFVHGMREAGVATTAKHFPGLGRVEGNTDFTGAVVDTVTTSADAYLKPFGRAVAVHVPFVMMSLATYDLIDADHLAAFSPRLIDQVLRRDLGFRGVVMSDSLTAKAVADMTPGQRAIDFILAGGDMIVLGPIDVAAQMAQAVAARAGTDTAFRARVDQSALRILQAKDEAGLLPCSG